MDQRDEIDEMVNVKGLLKYIHFTKQTLCINRPCGGLPFFDSQVTS